MTRGAFAVALTLAAVARAYNDSPDEPLYPITSIDKELITLAESKDAKSDALAVREVLSRGADPSAKGDYNYTALMWSIVRHKPDVVDVLLDAGADTEFTNVWGTLAIDCHSAQRPDTSVVFARSQGVTRCFSRRGRGSLR